MRADPPAGAPPEPTVVVLAAGAATRFGSDKLLALVAGRRLLDWTLDAVLAHVPAAQTIVVVPAIDHPRARLAHARGLHTVPVPDAREGVSRSLAAGLRAALPGAGVVVLADDPLVVRALPRVLAAALIAPDAVIAVRRTEHTPHPVHLPARLAGRAGTGEPDRGLRGLLAGADVVWVDGTDLPTCDVDVPADAERLASLLRQLPADSAT